MLSNTKQIILLVSVLLLAGFLYLWKISSIPTSLYADETTVGYNAYSILTTGKDEYGQSYPVLFRLFGAYTPSLFIYFLVPFVNYFGLNAFSLRFPSALATLLLIPFIYLLVKSLKIFQNKYSSFLAVLIFSLTPWVVFNARLGYEVTLGYVLFYLGVFFLWTGLSNNKLSLVGLLFLSFATYTAHTERYLVPLFLLIFFYLFKKKIFNKQNRTSNILYCFVCLLTQLPHFLLLTTPAFWVKNTSFAASNLQSGVLDFVGQLVIYFSPHTYFGASTADINHQHFIPELSLFYSWQIFPFLVGLFYLLKSARTSAGKLVLLLLVTSPIPGAMSGHFISIQRVLPVLVPIVLVVTLGLEKILNRIPKTFFPLLFALISLSLILFWRSYFVLLPGLWTNWWNFGAKEIASIISQNSQPKIVIDNSRDQALYSPIIFYLQFPPEIFQKQFLVIRDNYYKNPPFSSVVSFGNATTRPINWETDPLTEAILIGDVLSVSDEQAAEHFLTHLTSIKDSTGKVHYNVYKTNPDLKKQDNTTKMKRAL